MKAKKGISLIVLVITIIVIIILAGAVIFTLAGNNPTEKANYATFLDARSQLQDKVTMTYATNFETLSDLSGEALSTKYETLLTADLAKANAKFKFGAFSVNADSEVIFTVTGDEPTWLSAQEDSKPDWVK